MHYSKALERALNQRDAVLKIFQDYGDNVTAAVVNSGGQPIIRVSITKLKKTVEHTHFRFKNILVEVHIN